MIDWLATVAVQPLNKTTPAAWSQGIWILVVLFILIVTLGIVSFVFGYKETQKRNRKIMERKMAKVKEEYSLKDDTR